MIEFTEEDRKRLVSDEMLAVAAEAFEQEVGLPDGFEWPCGSTDEALRPSFEAVAAKLAERPAGDAEGLREWLRSDEAAKIAVAAFAKRRAEGCESLGFSRRMADALAALADSTEGGERP
jgi:hypothetical protein